MKNAFIHTILSFITIWLLSFVFFNLSALDPYEKIFKDFSYLDLYNSKNLFKNETINPNIVLINIEKHNRKELALLIDHLSEQNPSVIGVDAIFKNEISWANDSILNSVIRKNNSILIGSYIIDTISENKTKSVTKNNEFFNISTTGFINFSFKNSNLEIQKDRVIRNFIGKIGAENSFALAVVKKHSPNHTIKKNISKKRPIKYFGNYTNFLTLNYNAAMAQDSIPSLKGKILLLGYIGSSKEKGNGTDIEDKKFTPLNKEFTGKTLPDMFGVVIHANIINMLLENNFIVTIPYFFVLFIGFIISFFSALLFIPLSNKYIGAGIMIKFYQFGFTFIILWVSLLLYSKGVELPVFFIISITVLSLELIPFFDYINKRLTKKWKWRNIY